jgi:hypothetical protein
MGVRSSTARCFNAWISSTSRRRPYWLRLMEEGGGIVPYPSKPSKADQEITLYFFVLIPIYLYILVPSDLIALCPNPCSLSCRITYGPSYKPFVVRGLRLAGIFVRSWNGHWLRSRRPFRGNHGSSNKVNQRPKRIRRIREVGSIPTQKAQALGKVMAKGDYDANPHS